MTLRTNSKRMTSRNELNHNDNHFASISSCQLSKANGWVYYGTHLLPACLLLLANCIIFGLLLRVLIQSTNTRIGIDKNVLANIPMLSTVYLLPVQ